jgi:hypothetical protein
MADLDGFGRTRVVRIALHTLESVRYEALVLGLTFAYPHNVILHRRTDTCDILDLLPPKDAASGWADCVADTLRQLGMNAVVAPEWTDAVRTSRVGSQI